MSDWIAFTATVFAALSAVIAAASLGFFIVQERRTYKLNLLKEIGDVISEIAHSEDENSVKEHKVRFRLALLPPGLPLGSLYQRYAPTRKERMYFFSQCIRPDHVNKAEIDHIHLDYDSCEIWYSASPGEEPVRTTVRDIMVKELTAVIESLSS